MYIARELLQIALDAVGLPNGLGRSAPFQGTQTAWPALIEGTCVWNILLWPVSVLSAASHVSRAAYHDS